MLKFVFFLCVKQPNYDSFAMVPVQGISGTERDFKTKIEPYYQAHVRSTYPKTYCEVKRVPIVAKLALNMNKTKIVKTYNERVGKNGQKETD